MVRFLRLNHVGLSQASGQQAFDIGGETAFEGSSLCSQLDQGGIAPTIPLSIRVRLLRFDISQGGWLGNFLSNPHFLRRERLQSCQALHQRLSNELGCLLGTFTIGQLRHRIQHQYLFGLELLEDGLEGLQEGGAIVAGLKKGGRSKSEVRYPQLALGIGCEDGEGVGDQHRIINPLRILLRPRELLLKGKQREPHQVATGHGRLAEGNKNMGLLLPPPVPHRSFWDDVPAAAIAEVVKQGEDSGRHSQGWYRASVLLVQQDNLLSSNRMGIQVPQDNTYYLGRDLVVPQARVHEQFQDSRGAEIIEWGRVVDVR
eukprot:Hpha_TRINITY_DN15371_c1_g11::TRINITY_DN15371_c1_g11_i1::g.92320::m.92320